MKAKIKNIEPNSIAEELGIQPNAELISINDIQPSDIIDYRYLVTAEQLVLKIRHANGNEEIFDIEKDFEDDLGISFESVVFDKILPCTNKCIFCFVDQQPPELRESLYLKDDDYRLSFLQGTYITLTNLNARHKARIGKLRPGPLYISVHTTNPDLRTYMLKNPKAGNIMKDLKWLNALDIPIHTQIVLCPGINDSAELDRTLNDLALLKSNILSIAVVPVGITKYRQDNVLVGVNSKKAEEVINQIAKFNKKVGYNLAFPSDEFYILANQNMPDSKFFGDFGQLDDGVGTCRLLADDFENYKKNLPASINKNKNLTIATGKIAYKTILPVINSLNIIKNLNIDLIPINSNFWGKDITVTGLITGSDLLDNLLPIKSKITDLVLPSVMIRKYTDQFLDDITIENIRSKLECNIHIIEDYYSFDELINLIVS